MGRTDSVAVEHSLYMWRNLIHLCTLAVWVCFYMRVCISAFSLAVHWWLSKNSVSMHRHQYSCHDWRDWRHPREHAIWPEAAKKAITAQDSSQERWTALEVLAVNFQWFCNGVYYNTSKPFCGFCSMYSHLSHRCYPNSCPSVCVCVCTSAFCLKVAVDSGAVWESAGFGRLAHSLRERERERDERSVISTRGCVLHSTSVNYRVACLHCQTQQTCLCECIQTPLFPLRRPHAHAKLRLYLLATDFAFFSSSLPLCLFLRCSNWRWWMLCLSGARPALICLDFCSPPQSFGVHTSHRLPTLLSVMSERHI